MIRVLAIIALAGSVATAAPTPESKAAMTEGQRLFRAGQYLDSVASFEHAYAIDPDPAYLFDIAQAYRLAKECAKALEFYDRFLHEVPDPPNADKIRGYRDDSAACVKAQTPPTPPDLALIDKPEHPQPPAPTAPDRGGTLRVVGLVTIAVGIVAAGAGVYFSTRVADLQNQRNGVCADGCLWDQSHTDLATDLDARGHRAQTSSIVAYTIAGVAITTGAVLYVIGRGRRGGEHVNLAAAPQPGGGVVVARFAF